MEHIKLFEDCAGEYRCVGVTEALEFVGLSIGEEVSEEDLNSFRNDELTEGSIVSVRKSFGELDILIVGNENIRFGRRRTFYSAHSPNRIGIHTKEIHSKCNILFFNDVITQLKIYHKIDLECNCNRKLVLKATQ